MLTRKLFALITSACLSISVIFLIVVEIGSTYNKAVLRDIWFIKLDLSNIVPISVPNAVLINSVAQTLGLHDYYTVGLWGFCEGNDGTGFTSCSKPKALYWFNPVEILVDQLLSGAVSTFATFLPLRSSKHAFANILSQSLFLTRLLSTSISSKSLRNGCSASSSQACAFQRS